MNPEKPTPRKFKIDPAVTSRILMVILVLALVALTMWISGPVPEKDLPTATVATISTLPSNWYVSIPSVTAATIMPSATPEATEDQVSTSGVIIGVASVMGIVLIGTLFSIWQGRDKSGKKRK
jgi:hypothetical protein